MVIHSCPQSGSSIMPCCGRTPYEVPRTDRLTIDGRVTCKSRKKSETQFDAARREEYLQRLRAFVTSQYKDRKEWAKDYWTESRRNEQAEKLRAYYTPERKRAMRWKASISPPPKPRKRVVPKLPDDTLIWRAEQMVYHLRRNCPAIPANSKLKRGKLGAMKTIGRQLCYYESFHWKKETKAP